MGTLSQCCCDCCITPEEMPWTEVTLKAPYEDCGPPVIGVDPEPPSYPTAQFVRQSCCYVADFPFTCQPWSFNCQLWAHQDFDISFDKSVYGVKAAYASNQSGFDCPCILTQTESTSRYSKDRLFAAARYRLSNIRVHVGKVLVKCDGDAEAACKFYIAATYEFDVDYGTYLKQYLLTSEECVGVYRDGFCSTTETYTSESGTNTDTCNIDATYFDSNPSFSDVVRISRIKFYDTLPIVPVSLSDADEPPVSCCGGDAGCEPEISPCGLNIVDNCVAFFTFDLESGDLSALSNCAQILDDESILVHCPTVEAKQGFTGTTIGFTLDANGCATACVNDIGEGIQSFPSSGYACTKDYPGLDRLYCYSYFVDGEEVRVYFPSTIICNLPYEFCTVEGCSQQGNDCILLDGPDCFGSPFALVDCPDVYPSAFGDNDRKTCRVDISNLSCTKGAVEVNTLNAICFALPTVNLEFA